MKIKKGKIWNEGEWWNVNDYNERLSKENKEINKSDKIFRREKERRDREIKKIWRR